MTDSKVQKLARLADGDNTSGFHYQSEGLLCLSGRVVVPEDDTLREEILSQAHRSKLSVHPGSNKMYKDLRTRFWWKGMKRNVYQYVSKCLVCQQVKAEYRRPGGLLQNLPIPEWKWEHITMDFVTHLPMSVGNGDAIWVVVDRLTKSAHFLPYNRDFTFDRMARLYIQEIVRFHGVPVSIVSDRDPRFTSRFWGSFQQALGTTLSLSTAYHPETDGQSERTIRTLEDMLRSCVMDFGPAWQDHLPLIEFAYNNSFHRSIGMSPFEALYGRRCRTPLFWEEVGERQVEGPELIQQAMDKVLVIKQRIKTAQDRQASNANTKRRPLHFDAGEKVFLKVSPFRRILRFGLKGKLSPRFIGPFEILECVGDLAYRLALPPYLSSVHNVFHVSLLRRYVADESHVLHPTEVQLNPDLSFVERPVSILDRKDKVLRNKTIPLVLVQWQRRGTEEATWELESRMRSEHPELF